MKNEKRFESKEAVGVEKTKIKEFYTPVKTIDFVKNKKFMKH